MQVLSRGGTASAALVFRYRCFVGICHAYSVLCLVLWCSADEHVFDSFLVITSTSTALFSNFRETDCRRFAAIQLNYKQS
jgi:hypothetical protein